MTPYFVNRTEAGKFLAKELGAYKNQQNTIILALPRGGVPVAFEIAKALHLPFDLMLVRKLGVPGHEEFAMGAIAMGNVLVLHEETIAELGIPKHIVKYVTDKERKELMRRNLVYRDGKAAPEIKDKTVILVDDGCATGANMQAATEAAKQQGAARVIVAVPIASDSARDSLSRMAEEIVCPFIPEHFSSLGHAYIDFGQTKDQEVIDLLERAEQSQHTLYRNKGHDHECA